MNEASTFRLSKEIEAATVLREQIASLVEGDADFLAEAIEGETSLFEQVDALVISVRHDEALSAGTDRLIKELKGRQDALDKRAELKRSLIGSALEIAGVKKRETPAGTVTVKDVAPKVVITDEAALPSRYLRQADPTPDKKAIGEALKAREAAWAEAAKITDGVDRAEALAKVDSDYPAVPGASLSNGSRTIQIRG